MELEKLETLKGIQKELIQLNETMNKIFEFQSKLSQTNMNSTNPIAEVLKTITEKINVKGGGKNGG